MKLLKTKIVPDGRPPFVVYHNVPEAKLKEVVIAWVNDAGGSKNPKDLARLLNSIGYICYTEKQYKRFGSKKIKPMLYTDRRL